MNDDVNGTKFTSSSTLECPDCSKIVQVGTAGFKNLGAHRGSKACRQARCKRTKGTMSKKPSKPDQVLDAFFKPRVPLNPSTVSAPPPIRPGEASTPGAPERYTIDCADALANAEPTRRVMVSPLVLPDEREASPSKGGVHRESQALRAKACQRGVSLLQDLEAALNRIPNDTLSATPEHRLSVFAVDPRTCVAKPGEDDWMILNQMMKSAFGWGEAEMVEVIPQLLNRGQYGLDGFIRFMTFFVCERGLEGALFETKVDALLKELRDR